MASSTEHIDELLEWRPGAADAARTNVFAAFAWGARRASSSWALILLLWLVFVALALGGGDALLAALRAPAGAADAWSSFVNNTVGGSPFGRPLARGLYRVVAFESPIRLLWVPSAWFLLLYGVLSGGAIAWLHGPRPAPLLAQLGAACGRYLCRFARLLVAALLLGWLIATLSSRLPISEVQAVPGAAMVVALVASILLLAAILDYARVRTVTRDSRSMILELLRSARFFVRNFPHTLALELLLLAVTLVIAGASLAMHQVLAGLLSARAAEFLAVQLLVVALLWLRLAAWGAMLSLYQGLTLRRLERS